MAHITPSVKELKFAKHFLIKESQKLHYQEESEALRKKGNISEKSSIRKLNSKLNNGLMVMISILNNLHQMPEQVKNPIILPKDARITQLLILCCHKIFARSGPELTLRNIRVHYWVPGGRIQIRKTIKVCEHNICKYPNTPGATQQMANLPIPRISPGNFEAISLDFAGPFHIKLCGICKQQKKM